jgi:hypothetical protein
VTARDLRNVDLIGVVETADPAAMLRLRFLSLELPRFVTTPAEDGRHVWEALFMPYMANGNVANPAGTTESRGIVVVPASLRLARAGRASVRPGTFASAIATLVQGSLQARKRVTFLSGTRANDLRPAGSKLTTATGRASVTRRAPRRGALFFQALYGPTDVTGAGCGTPATALAPAGCTSATLSELASPVVKISVRR